MSLPAAARDARRVGGGDINEAWHVSLDGRDAFVKTRPDAGKGEYALEAGLPESFNVLIKELQSLCLNVELIEASAKDTATAAED